MTGDPKPIEETYDATRDAHDSYFLAVEMKRRRGDRHWPEALCLVDSGPVPAMNSREMNVTSGEVVHDN
jgi:hypothetical protein